MLPNRKDSRYNWEILKILFIWFVICGCVIFQRIFFNQCYTLNILEIKFSLAISYDIAKNSRIPFDADITCQTSFIKKLPFTYVYVTSFTDRHFGNTWNRIATNHKICFEICTILFTNLFILK